MTHNYFHSFQILTINKYLITNNIHFNYFILLLILIFPLLILFLTILLIIFIFPSLIVFFFTFTFFFYFFYSFFYFFYFHHNFIFYMKLYMFFNQVKLIKDSIKVKMLLIYIHIQHNTWFIKSILCILNQYDFLLNFLFSQSLSFFIYA